MALTCARSYAECQWDEKSIKSLVAHKRLAPLSVGLVDEQRVPVRAGVVRVCSTIRNCRRQLARRDAAA